MLTSSNPTVLTQYPVDQKFSPVTLLFPIARWIRTALLPFRKPILWATLYFGGMLKHKWIWSAIACPSSNSNPFCLHKSRIISPIFLRNFPYITRFRYFGIKTTWYLQSHRTCDKLFQSFIGSTSLSLSRGFPCVVEPILFCFTPKRSKLFGSHGQRPWVYK